MIKFWKKYKKADYFERIRLLKTLAFKFYLSENKTLQESFYSTLESYISDIIDERD